MSGEEYELVFSRPGNEDADTEDAEDTVVVGATGTLGPGGHPVYADRSGIVRAEISDQGEVRMLATGGHQRVAQPIVVRRR